MGKEGRHLPPTTAGQRLHRGRSALPPQTAGARVTPKCGRHTQGSGLSWLGLTVPLLSLQEPPATAETDGRRHQPRPAEGRAPVPAGQVLLGTHDSSASQRASRPEDPESPPAFSSNNPGTPKAPHAPAPRTRSSACCAPEPMPPLMAGGVAQQEPSQPAPHRASPSAGTSHSLSLHCAPPTGTAREPLSSVPSRPVSHS